MPAPTTQPKLCFRCGQDCAARPRVRDGQGRYCCDACLTDAERARVTRPGAPGNQDDGIIALVPDQEIPTDDKKVCPACSGSAAPDALVCTHCGFDWRKGYQRGTGAGASFKEGGVTKCLQCGYDLRGLTTPRCPECGTIARRLTDRDRAEIESRRVARLALITPIVIMLLGLGAVAATYTLTGNPQRLIGYTGLFFLKLPIGLGALWLCTYLWLDLDAPLALTGLRLAAIYAGSDGLTLGLHALTGVGILAYILGCFAYLGLIVWLLDLDSADALGVAVVTFLVQLAALLALILLL